MTLLRDNPELAAKRLLVRNTVAQGRKAEVALSESNPGVRGEHGMLDSDKLTLALHEAAIRAARAALEIRRLGTLDTRRKTDNSPVSAGDMAANREIVDVLSAAFPRIPIVSEEADPPALRPLEPFFLVDPIDGTREYIAGGPEFTVNIALIRDDTPAAGIVVAPAMRSGFLASGGPGTGILRLNDNLETCHRLPHRSATGTAAERTATVSRSHLDSATRAWLDERRYDKRIPCGSSWKFCLLADNAAAVYPRLAATNTWDIAAGHAVLAAAGGRVLAPDGESPIRYESGGSIVPGFVAYAPGM